jgi:hypothetical protein
MDRMTEYIVRAAHELGLQITAPFCCHLGDAMEVVAVAYLPELGGTNGTLIFRSNQYDRTTFGVLQSRGFACSSFDDPLESEQYDLQSYMDMFIDWGWTLDVHNTPSWMRLGSS